MPALVPKRQPGLRRGGELAEPPQLDTTRDVHLDCHRKAACGTGSPWGIRGIPESCATLWSVDADRSPRRPRHEHGQDVLPEARADEGRPDLLLRRRRAVRPPPRSPSADADEALPGRRGRLFLLPE